MTESESIPTLTRPRTSAVHTSSQNINSTRDRFGGGRSYFTIIPPLLLTLGISTGCNTSQGNIYPTFRCSPRRNWSWNFERYLDFRIWPRWGQPVRWWRWPRAGMMMMTSRLGPPRPASAPLGPNHMQDAKHGAQPIFHTIYTQSTLYFTSHSSSIA